MQCSNRFKSEKESNPYFNNALEELLLLPILVFDDQPAVRSFVSLARKKNIDLSDLLIALDTLFSGCDRVLTFDKRAAESDLFILLEKQDS